jgi:hypothetical protein
MTASQSNQESQGKVFEEKRGGRNVEIVCENNRKENESENKCIYYF